jgi:hypothetical protein
MGGAFGSPAEAGYHRERPRRRRWPRTLEANIANTAPRDKR